MLWELFDDIKSYIKMTLIPSLRNLFSSVRALAGMLLVMLVLQLLLSVICIFGIENIKNQQAVLENFQAVLNSQNDIVKSAGGSFLTSNSARAYISSSSVFLGALCLWALCAAAVYAKVTFAAADRDKYIWGMYITHGATKKKIKKMLKCELYMPQLLATAAAYPVALWVLNRASAAVGQRYSHSIFALLCVLLISYICIRLVVTYQCFLIRSRSCVSLLSEEDAPKSVCFPRRHSRLRLGFTPYRYATSTFVRMRKYYISLAAVAAVPALIWVCFGVCVASQDAVLSSSVDEFEITLSDGIDGTRLSQIQDSELSKIEGISSVKANSVFDASKIYTHLIADSEKFSSLSLSVPYTHTYADGTLTVCRNDIALRQLIGNNSLPSVSNGEVCIVAPETGGDYAFEQGTRIYIAVSRTDGSVSVPQSMDELNENDYEYMELYVKDCLYLRDGVLTPAFFNNIDTTYFVFSDSDYQKITGVNVNSLSKDFVSGEYACSSPDERVHFTLSLPKNEFSISLAEGDIVDIRGILRCAAEVRFDGKSVQNDSISTTFDYLYIHSVSDTGDTVSLEVSPRVTLVVRERSGLYSPIYLALGTAAAPSGGECYFASTHADYTLSNISVNCDTTKQITVYKQSIENSGQHGAYAVLNQKQLGNTEGRIQLDTLYADNSFDLYYADGSQNEAYGVETAQPKDGSCVLVLPKSGSHYAFSVGDKLRIAVTLENVLTYNADSEVQGGSMDLLDTHLKTNEYKYITVYISEIIYSEQAQRGAVLLGKSDFSAVINKKAPYTVLTVSIDSEVESEQYAKIRERLSIWAVGNTMQTSISSTGNYLQHLLKSNSNYSTVLSLISLIIPLIIPFIWYYPLASFFDRRKTEVRLLHTFGKKRATVAACYAIEGLLLAVSAFLVTVVLCVPAMGIFKAVCTLGKLPLEFEYSFVSPSAVCMAAGACALCAFVAFCVCALSTKKKK